MASSSPTPGRAARGSSTGQPFSVLLDLLGRRWAITVLWSLRAGRLTYGQLKAQDPRISHGTLSTRLRELQDARLIETAPDGGYHLSTRGEELVAIWQPLSAWAIEWGADFDD